MTLKSDMALTLVSKMIPNVLRILGMTWMVKSIGTSYYYKRMFGSQTRAAYAIWHCDIMLQGYFHRNEGIRVLVSQHRDGDLSARVIQELGFTSIRGSTTRGGMRALRALKGIVDDPVKCDLAFTPDGPKGPPKKVQKGIIYAASKMGFPFVPVLIAVDRYWELNSWDRFKIPKPFSRSVVFYGSEIHVPDKLDSEELERYTRLAEDAMYRTEEKAQEALKTWLNGGAS